MRRPSPWSRKRSRDLTVWIGNQCWCWKWWPGVGTSVPCYVPLPADARRFGFKPEREVFDAMKMPQLEARATAGDVIPLPESVTLKKLPHLAELLLNPVWEEGPPKGQRSVMIFMEGSIVKMLVKVEAQRLKALVAARGLDEVLAGWEALLKANNVPWEQESEEKAVSRRKAK